MSPLLAFLRALPTSKSAPHDNAQHASTEADQNRSTHVERGACPRTVLHQRDALQVEGRVRGESAHDPGTKQQSQIGAKPSSIFGQHEQDAEPEGAKRVRGEGRSGETVRHREVAEEQRHRVPETGTCCTPDRHPDEAHPMLVDDLPRFLQKADSVSTC